MKELVDKLTVIVNFPEKKMYSIRTRIGRLLSGYTVELTKFKGDSENVIYISDDMKAYVIGKRDGDTIERIEAPTIKGINVGELSELTVMIVVHTVVKELSLICRTQEVSSDKIKAILTSINEFTISSIAKNQSTHRISHRGDKSMLHSRTIVGRRSFLRPLLIPHVYYDEDTSAFRFKLAYTTLTNVLKYEKDVVYEGKGYHPSTTSKLMPFAGFSSSLIPAFNSIKNLFEIMSHGNWSIHESFYDMSLEGIDDINGIIGDSLLTENNTYMMTAGGSLNYTELTDEESEDRVPEFIEKDSLLAKALEDKEKKFKYLELLDESISNKNINEFIRDVVKKTLVHYNTYRSIDTLLQVTDCIYEAMLTNPKKYIKSIEHDIFRVLTTNISRNSRTNEIVTREYKVRKRNNLNTQGVSMYLNNLMTIMLMKKLYDIKMLSRKEIHHMPEALRMNNIHVMIRDTNIFDFDIHADAIEDSNEISIIMADHKTGFVTRMDSIPNTQISKGLDSIIHMMLYERELSFGHGEEFDDTPDEEEEYADFAKLMFGDLDMC